MQMSDDIHAVLNAIHRRDRFLISAHARPDGDAVGSVLACGMILDQMGKNVDLVSCDRVPLIYRGLPCASTIRQVERVEGDYDAVILDVESAPFVDVTAARMLVEAHEQLRSEGIRLVLARAIGQVRDVLACITQEDDLIAPYAKIDAAVEAVR